MVKLRKDEFLNLRGEIRRLSDTEEKFPLSKEQTEELLVKYPINHGYVEKDFDVEVASDLNKYNDWIIIDSTQGIGINYALKKGRIVYVYTGRYFSSSFMMMNTAQFDLWRVNIKSNKGN